MTISIQAKSIRTKSIRETALIPLTLRWIAGLALGLFGLTPQLNAQTPPAKTVAPPPIKAVNRAVVEEINSIRNQLGGGVGEQLKGIIDDPELKAQLKSDFDDALYQRLDPSRPKATHTRQSSLGDPDNRVKRGDEARLQTPPAANTVPSLGSRDRPGVHLLRSTARKLELIAADLEEQELYPEADSIREQARIFWAKSRTKAAAK